MHYCQACDDPQLMMPEDGVARCPVCGGIEVTAATRPLFVVTGASASGKTTVFPELLRCLAGRCLVFDVDWLIDPLGRAAKDGEIDWAAFRDAWLHVAHGVAQNGLPTLLLGPFIPEHLEGLPGRSGVGEINYLVLDCPDDLRRRRIEARPAWRSRDISAQTEFGRWLRKNLAPVIDTSTRSPAEVATEVAAWVEERIAAAGSKSVRSRRPLVGGSGRLRGNPRCRCCGVGSFRPGSEPARNTRQELVTSEDLLPLLPGQIFRKVQFWRTRTSLHRELSTFYGSAAFLFAYTPLRLSCGGMLALLPERNPRGTRVDNS